MRLPFVIVVVIFVLCTGPAWAKEPIRIIEGVVAKVSDGDTVQVQDPLGTKVKVRLYGIDAPETEKRNRKTGRISKPGQPFGEEAFQALKGKMGGQRVRVEVRDIDRYRRAVSVVRLSGRDIN
jgi:micrococcal nuclease